MNTSLLMFFFAFLGVLIGGIYLFFYLSGKTKKYHFIFFSLSKFMQAIGLILLGMGNENPDSNFFYPGLFITTGIAAEVFVFSSYDQLFQRGKFIRLHLIFLLGILAMSIGYTSRTYVMVTAFGIGNGLLMISGSYYLFGKKPNTALARLIGIDYFLFGIVWFMSAWHAIANRNSLDLLSTDNIAHMLISVFTVITFAFGSIGLIMLQKELDEKQIRENAKKIQADNDALIALNATKNRFFSIIAHDLRSPIGGLSQLGELLAGDTNLEDEERNNIIQLISHTAKNSFILLENLLLWARSESGELQMHPEKLDLVPLIQNTIHVLQGNAKQKQLTIQMDMPEKLMISADPSMLSTVFRNLLSNAIKFSYMGGEIRIVGRELENKHISIRFEDDGIGIPEENQKNLLSLDANYSTPGTQSEVGSGLGLKLCREFIERHQGSIALLNEKAGSTIFQILLPKTPYLSV